MSGEGGWKCSQSSAAHPMSQAVAATHIKPRSCIRLLWQGRAQCATFIFPAVTLHRKVNPTQCVAVTPRTDLFLQDRDPRNMRYRNYEEARVDRDGTSQ